MSCAIVQCYVTQQCYQSLLGPSAWRPLREVGLAMTAYLTRRLSRVALVGGAAVAAMMLSACGNGLASGGGEQSSDKGPIVLGMLTPLSGSSSAIGPYMKNGAQLAVDEINGKGGVNGRNLELKVEDEACDAKSATAGANKLVTAGVKISVGGYCSGATLPTLPIFEKADVPMLIPAANSNELVKQHKKNVFLINGTGAQQSDAAFKFMKKVGATKVAPHGRQHQLLQGHRRHHRQAADRPAGARRTRVGHRGRERLQRQRQRHPEGPAGLHLLDRLLPGGWPHHPSAAAGRLHRQGHGRRRVGSTRSWWTSPAPRPPKASSPP